MKNSFKKEKLGKMLTTVFFAIISVAYIFPVAMVVINSFKKEHLRKNRYVLHAQRRKLCRI